MIGKLFSKTGALDKLRSVDAENTKERAWLGRARVAMEQRLKAATDATWAALCANPCDETLSTHFAALSDLERFNPDYKDAIFASVKTAVFNRCSARTRQPLREALESIISRLEGECDKCERDERDRAESLGCGYSKSGTIRHLENTINEAKRHLREVEAGDWSALSAGVRFCLEPSPSAQSAPTPPKPHTNETNVPKFPGSELHEFLHPPARASA